LKAIKRILEYLVHDSYEGPLIIAPGAPPVCRTPDGMHVAADVILTAQDVIDTLICLKSLEPIASLSAVESLSPQTLGVSPDWAAKASGLKESDSFSFGIMEVGRFRVDFLTQRGSKIVSIARIPLEIPDLGTLCLNAETAHDIADRVMGARSGILAVWGPSIVSSGIFVYSLLRAINEAGRKVIYILERSLTFLMNHNNSIVIQSEIDTDAGSFETGLRGAYPFGPNIIFLGDIWPGEEIPSLQSAETKGAVAIVSSSSMTGTQLLSQYGVTDEVDADDGPGILRAAIRVAPEGTDAVTISVVG
jgi:hypothetical protein